MSKPYKVDVTLYHLATQEHKKEFEEQAKRIRQLEGEEPIPFAWWKDCPGLAQKVMERIMEKNDKLITVLQGMVPFIEDDFPNGTGVNHGTCATDQYQQACDAVIQAL